MNDTTMTRRAFGLGVLGTAAGCESNRTATTLMEGLRGSGLKFIDSTGAEVNLSGLEAQLRGTAHTMTFQFAQCGNTCPATALALAGVSENYPNAQHVIIDVMPLGDFNGIMDSALTGQGLRLRNIHANPNTIVLYPTIDGTPNGFIGAIDKIKNLQERFGLTVGADPTINHSGEVIVYGTDTKEVGRVYRTERITSELPGILERAEQVIR